MLKSILFGLSVVSLTAGCVSVSGPSAAPSLAPTFGITTPAPATLAVTASPSVNPTVAPTPTPTDEPTETPTERPTAPPTASPVPVTGDALFVDNMDDPSSGWSVGDTGVSSVAYVDGVLQFAIQTGDNAIWTPRQLGDEYGVVLAVGGFVLRAPGSFGLLCSGSDGVYYGVLVTTEGALLFLSIDDTEVTVLQRFDDLELDVPLGVRTALGLECAGTSTGALRLVPVMRDTGPLAIYQRVNQGPAAFTRVGLYAEAFEDGFQANVDPAAAYGLPGSTEGMTPEGEDLLAHIPEDWQETCLELPVTENATAIIQCVLQTKGAGPELAVYEQYATNVEMDAQYQEVIDRYGVESTGTCASGPNETTWSIDDEMFGRVQCAPQKVGIRFDWTDDRLSILSSLFDFEGKYEFTSDAWIEAGPNL